MALQAFRYKRVLYYKAYSSSGVAQMTAADVCAALLRPPGVFHMHVGSMCMGLMLDEEYKELTDVSCSEFHVLSMIHSTIIQQ